MNDCNLSISSSELENPMLIDEYFSFVKQIIPSIDKHISKLKALPNEKDKSIIEHNNLRQTVNLYQLKLNGLAKELEKVNNENLRLQAEIKKLENNPLKSSIKELNQTLFQMKNDITNIKDLISNQQIKEFKQEIVSVKEDINQIKDYLLYFKEQEPIKKISDTQDKVTEIKNSFLGKTKLNEATQNKMHTKIREILNLPINNINKTISLSNIHSNIIHSPIQLHDGRIATGSSDKSISICSFDFSTKTFKQDIKKENAHDHTINTLHELRNNLLISGSNDKTIKLWDVSQNELVLKKTISEHSKEVWKVISLDNSKWASCSDDHLVIIWSSQEPFSKIQTLTNDSDVVSIIKLKNRDILVASCYNPPAVVFWNLKTYKKEQTVEDVRTGFSTHMIELINQHIAISDNRAPHPIVIIDTFEYKIIKRIYDSNYMNFQSSLMVLNSYLFMYIYSGKILVISTKDYKIIYKNQEIENLHGNGGFITINDGKYLVVGTNKSYGLEILEIDY